MDRPQHDRVSYENRKNEPNKRHFCRKPSDRQILFCSTSSPPPPGGSNMTTTLSCRQAVRWSSGFRNVYTHTGPYLLNSASNGLGVWTDVVRFCTLWNGSQCGARCMPNSFAKWWSSGCAKPSQQVSEVAVWSRPSFPRRCKRSCSLMASSAVVGGGRDKQCERGVTGAVESTHNSVILRTLYAWYVRCRYIEVPGGGVSKCFRSTCYLR